MVTFISAFTGRGKEHDAWEKGFAEASGGSKLGDDNYDAEYTKYVAIQPEPRSTLKDVADHVEHIRKVAGVDHVGLGSDFYGSKTDMAIGLEDTSRYPYLFAELIRRGWTDAELVKLSRGNLLRAFRGAEETSVRLQKTQRPSFATIEELDQGKDEPNLY